MKNIKSVVSLFLSILFTIITLVVLHDAFGRHKVASSIRRFEDAVRSDLSVGLFYFSKSLNFKKNKSLRNKIKRLRKTFKQVSKSYPFDYAEITFVSVNLSKRKLETVLDDYGIPQPQYDNPVVVLFKGGSQIAVKKGFSSSHEIKTFVKKHFEKDINEIVKHKDLIRKRRLEESKRRAYERSYRWPYYGYGWGGGWSWPYYGRHWGYRRWYW